MHDNLCIRLYKHTHTQAWCNDKGYDTTIHPLVKCVLFLEDLLAEMVAKNSKDPFGKHQGCSKSAFQDSVCTSDSIKSFRILPLLYLVMDMVSS